MKPIDFAFFKLEKSVVYNIPGILYRLNISRKVFNFKCDFFLAIREFGIIPTGYIYLSGITQDVLSLPAVQLVQLIPNAGREESIFTMPTWQSFLAG